MSVHPRVVAALERLRNGATTLTLDGSDIGLEGAEVNRSLTYTDLENSDFGSEGAQAVGAALKENPSLISLSLKNMHISDEGAEAVGAALKENRSLTSLSLENIPIGDEFAKAVAVMLKENRSLTSLSIGNTEVGSEGAQAVGAALKENRSLISLSLEWSLIGFEGAIAVADALKENRSLTSLSLDYTFIGDEGAEVVAAALKENRSLTSLSLNGNEIGPEGAEAVADALKENRSLTSLSLAENIFCDEGAEAVAEALGENYVLQELLLDDDISQHVKDYIGYRLKLAKDTVDQFTKSALNAFSKDEKVRWGRAKLMVVGKGGAGKTSTIRTLLGQSFVAEHDSTIGVDLKVIRTKDWKEDPLGIHSADLNDALVRFQIYKDRKSLVHQSIPESLARLSGPRTDKTLKPELKVETREIAKEIFRADVKFQIEEAGRTKVEEDVSFSIWDYGGQGVFYTLHHLFLTKYGVYVIVFDMREVIGKNNFQDCSDYALMEDSETGLNTIRFWLESIRLHANGAKVVLVGTYLDALCNGKEDLKLINAELRKILPQAKGLRLVRNKTDQLYFYPVDNTERQDASRCELLRNLLMTTAASEPYVQEEVPLRWSLCFDRMFRTKKDYMELDAVYELAMGSCGISKDDAMKMLKYMHELGVIVHLTSTPILVKYVILQPQWLLDNLSRVICDPTHMEVHLQKMEEASLEADIPTDWFCDLDTWGKRGVASQLFLSTIWGQPFLVEYFSKLMTEMLLASRSPWIGDLDAEGALLIPSLLKTISEDELDDLLLQFEGAALVYIEFDFFPKGVFQRFIASMVSKFPEGLVEVEQVHANAASIIFDVISVLLVPDDTRRRIIMYFENDEEDENSDLKRTLTNVVQLLHSQLQSIDEAFMKQKLNSRLFLSCDGTTNDQSCASISVLANPRRSKVLSVGRRALHLSSFRLFFASKDEAEELESKIIAQREKNYDVFLSHAWGKDKKVHKLVCRISDELQNNHSISCWLDRNEVQHGDIIRTMTDGIDDSTLGIVFVTREYMDKVNSDPKKKKKDNCRFEFRHMMDIMSPTRLIPVVVEEAMQDMGEWKSVFRSLWEGIPVYESMTHGGNADEVKALSDRIRRVLSEIKNK